MIPIRRRFLQVGDRRVHYFRAGEGPPAVLIHSSPANARLLMKEIERLSQDYTVFAFDTPGFGLSQPLPLAEMEVADLADALAQTLEAIGMPACPIFGSHTGAAIALEFGVRHPERATGLVLDGVPAFTQEECARYFGDYFRKLPVTDLGGHYAEIWTRFRDQSIWFPWSGREVDNLNPYDLGAPGSTHLWTSMYFEAAETYTPAYRAASYYGQRALTAAAALELPVIFTATETDMLYSHMQRLPAMKAHQEIRSIGTSYEAKRELIAQGFAMYGADGPAPAVQDALVSCAAFCTAISRQFLDGSVGQIHLRYCGDRRARVLLLIHDAPGSAEQMEPFIAALGAHAFVIAPDLPGHGESDPLAGPDLDAFADELIALLDRLDMAVADVIGIGFGSALAARLAARHPARVTSLTVNGALLPTASEREKLVESFAPPITIEADGGHWYRTWLMLRDSKVWWPWFDRRKIALRRIEGDFSARPLHRWTMDVMRARATYADLIKAALDGDMASDLDRATMPLTILSDPAVPLFAYDAALRGQWPAAPVLACTGDLAILAASLIKMLRTDGALVPAADAPPCEA